ncbi:hypothetical protein K438DRAFT_2023479 [Mycena galopus ATCC 62051]|nr:hypothetical protein K438DRAFT_2023479 [Mycena galopus ATCC 62051]
MSQTYSLHIQSANHIVYKPGIGHQKSPNLYVTISEASSHLDKTPVSLRSLEPKWDFKSFLSPKSISSPLTLRLYHDSSVPGFDKVLGECRITIEDLLELCASSEEPNSISARRGIRQESSKFGSSALTWMK